jgi:hypothetical protein
MLISSLVQHNSHFQRTFSREENGAEPGVRRVQGWIDEAWNEGFDPDGRAHFGGKIMGGKKWIGTSDVAAMFAYKGVQ